MTCFEKEGFCGEKEGITATGIHATGQYNIVVKNREGDDAISSLDLCNRELL